MATVGTSGLERALVGTVPDVRRGQLAVDARAIGVIEVEKSGPAKKSSEEGSSKMLQSLKVAYWGWRTNFVPRSRDRASRRGEGACRASSSLRKSSGAGARARTSRANTPSTAPFRGKAPRGPVSSRRQRPYLAPHGGRKGICAEIADRADATRGQS